MTTTGSKRYTTKLTPDIVRDIREKRLSHFTYRELSRYVLLTYGVKVSHQAVERAVTGYTWKHVK